MAASGQFLGGGLRRPFGQLEWIAVIFACAVTGRNHETKCSWSEINVRAGRLLALGCVRESRPGYGPQARSFPQSAAGGRRRSLAVFNKAQIFDHAVFPSITPFLLDSYIPGQFDTFPGVFDFKRPWLVQIPDEQRHRGNSFRRLQIFLRCLKARLAANGGCKQTGAT
jgi:hypothetical protein